MDKIVPKTISKKQFLEIIPNPICDSNFNYFNNMELPECLLIDDKELIISSIFAGLLKKDKTAEILQKFDLKTESLPQTNFLNLIVAF